MSPQRLPAGDFNEDGDLYVWPENQPAVSLWLLIGDQWRRAGLEGQPVAFEMGIALEYAREMAKVDETIQVIELTQKIRYLSSCVLEIMDKRRQR